MEGKMNYKERTQLINKLQRKYPNTRRQRTSHGAGQYSVQFIDKKTGELLADISLK
jgi:hypothetical protein